MSPHSHCGGATPPKSCSLFKLMHLKRDTVQTFNG
ncbi:Uncharacterised protein [Vibrio cholerae]|nr:Uncharacterised protein [Vibrio cholerae]